LTALSAYVGRQREAFAANVSAAESLAAANPLARSLPPAESAALVCAARVLFNTDNFITRE
jgi:hypothetical protein